MPDEEPQESAPTMFDQRSGVDWLLAYIVRMAEGGLEVGVTILADGQMMSGVVISGKKFFVEVGKQIGTAPSRTPENKEIVEGLGTIVGNFAQIYTRAEGDNILADDTFQPAYLHLRDAKPILAPTSVTGPGALWRVQLDRISAYTLSTMSYG
ncbi:hypothetical protein FXB41_34580 [Bradyrhizobium canariense]|uniref:hypothetical protein n=1 Tax=Bradyrhizobium canariense TaxID=255045 RepID=UPI001CA52898|nr:hypothetical protein [Bradyrhizobium canariense]MBW5439697.1 hypothetical protein [Bradyrhizobium canariense]